MSFLDTLIEKDKELLVFLNSLGVESWDSFWMTITNQFNWSPLFLLILILIFKAYGWKKGLVFLLVTAVLVTFSDQLVNLIKDSVGRLRPNNDTTINETIRILKRPSSFSFVSGHSTTSFATTTLMILALRKFYKYPYLLLIWPILFAYSRIYLGVHFPLDIFVGMLLGVFEGYLFYKIAMYFFKKMPENRSTF